MWVYQETETNAAPLRPPLPEDTAGESLAEKEAMTLVEKDPDSTEAKIFLELAGKLLNQPRLYPAQPLSEEQMELFMRGDTPSQATAPVQEKKPAVVIPPTPAAPSGTKKRALSDPFSRVPLYGCAYRGAVAMPPKAAPGMPSMASAATPGEAYMNVESSIPPLSQDSSKTRISQ
mgnify:CR=1 FL=1